MSQDTASTSNAVDPWTGVIERAWAGNPFRKMVPFDPLEMTRMIQTVWIDAVTHPDRMWSQYADLTAQYSRLLTTNLGRFWGIADGHAKPVAEPDKADKRFAGPAWQQNVVYDSIKQAYLIAATTLLKSAEQIEGLDAEQHLKLMFYARQFVDMMSPTNFAFTNPEVLHELMASGGQSLVRGMNNLLRDLARGEIKMTDTDAFAPGRNLAVTPGHVVYRNKLIELIQYTPTTPTVHQVPLLLIPNWINKYYIVDLQPSNSLVRYMLDQGFTFFVISWKNPDASMEDIGFDDYLEFGPLAALRVVEEITGSDDVNAIGYCIGGTLLGMTLAYLAARGEDDLVRSATFFVSLLDFSEVGDTAVFIDEASLAYVNAQMQQRGILESRQMASMFTLLRANDLIWSNVVNNYLLGKQPPAFDLLYWNSDGTRMTRAAHAFYLRNTYGENNLAKPDALSLKGVPLDLRNIHQDIYGVGAEQDHLVPWRAAWKSVHLTGGKVRFVVGAGGHIAGVIQPPMKAKSFMINEQPAASADEWLAGATRHPGSWWSDWVSWLRPRSGEQVFPPPMGGPAYPPLVPAPGTCVMEK